MEDPKQTTIRFTVDFTATGPDNDPSQCVKSFTVTCDCEDCQHHGVATYNTERGTLDSTIDAQHRVSIAEGLKGVISLLADPRQALLEVSRDFLFDRGEDGPPPLPASLRRPPRDPRVN